MPVGLQANHSTSTAHVRCIPPSFHSTPEPASQSMAASRPVGQSLLRQPPTLTRARSMSLEYPDECLVASLMWSRKFTRYLSESVQSVVIGRCTSARAQYSRMLQCVFLDTEVHNIPDTFLSDILAHSTALLLAMKAYHNTLPCVPCSFAGISKL